jgi:hypothetical protein
MQRWFWNSLPVAALLLSVPVWRDLFFAERLTVVPSRLDLRSVPVHEYQDIECVLRNGTSRPISFLGSTQNCNAERCIYVDDCPDRLAPGEERRVKVHVAANRPGPFKHEVVFFNTCPDLPRLIFEVVGTAVERN